MGLLGRAASRNSVLNASSQDVLDAISSFHQKHSSFHCVVMQFDKNKEEALCDIAEMTSFHGAVCLDMHGKYGLVMLPGGLDMELFSHQLSNSTGSTVIFQFTADSPSLANETLSSYLQ